MSGHDDIPIDTAEHVEIIEGILTARATGGAGDSGVYAFLRRELMADRIICGLLPKFVRTYRSLDAFWPFIKNEAPSYAERREIIGRAFTPVMDHLEGRNSSPADKAHS